MNKNQGFQLKRHPANPILKPDPLSSWESYNVLNPSVIYHNGLFHMHYRAQGVDWVSRIGYAVSHDGVRWNRLRQPVLTPKCEFETKGVEDPRVTEIDGLFYMTYCGNAPYREGVEYYGNIYPMIAKSANLVDWERIGPMVRGEDNKDHVLFPKKFKGRYCALHRRRPAIWIAYSDDLRTWPQAEMKETASPRPDCAWEGKYIGVNGVPIETEDGWLCFYHACDKNDVYRLGLMLTAHDAPSTVLSRPKEPILWPEEAWEVKGDVPNVIFSNANLLVGDTVYVYYGAADHVIGLATAELADLLAYVKGT